MPAPIAWLLVAAAVAACDFLWIVYVRAISEDRAAMTAAIGAAIHLASGLAVVSYVGDPAKLAAVVVGSVIGTVVSMKLARRKTCGSESPEQQRSP